MTLTSCADGEFRADGTSDSVHLDITHIYVTQGRALAPMA